MPTHSSENGGMNCGRAEGYRLCVIPSGTRESSRFTIACRASRLSPVMTYEISAWMRVSPTYCNCSQYGASM